MIGLVGFVVGVVLFVLLAVVEFSAWALVVPPRARKNDGAKPDGLDRAEPISTVPRDGARLAGLWCRAHGERPTGRTVLLLHGFAEASGALQAMRVSTLNEAGWNAVALDLRGYGESGGQFASFGGREADDVRCWLDTLEKKGSANQPFEPVLWGRSMGAAIAARAAALDPRVRALILESPMVDLDEAMAVWFRKRRAPLPRLLARLATRRAGRIAGVSLTRPRPIEFASRVHRPALIIHGTDDTLIPTAEVKRFAAALALPPRVIEVPGAGHADVIAIGGESLLEQVTLFLRDISTKG